MSPHPAFQRGVAYGDRFDGEIRNLLAEGLTCTAVGLRIGIAPHFVRERARLLGLWKPHAAQHARRGLSLSRAVRRAKNPSHVIAFTLTDRRDEGPTRLVRAARQRLFILDRDGLDPTHGVACLHLAGLTLPEIEGVTGYPASAVVAAVRAHCAPLGRAGL